MQRQAFARSLSRLASLSSSFSGDDQVLHRIPRRARSKQQLFCHRCVSALVVGPPNPGSNVADSSKTCEFENGPSDGEPSRRRNPALAAVIREGLPYLNQASSYIQESPHTRKPLVHTAAGLSRRGDKRGGGDPENALTPAQLKQGHRILSVASDCLEEVCRKNHHLTIHGEPIVLLHVHVQPSLQHATIYWTLPLSLLWDEDDDDSFHSNNQRDHLMMWMHEQLTTRNTPAHQALSFVQRKLFARLSSFKTPKLKWEPAPPELVHALQRYQHAGSDDDDDNGFSADVLRGKDGNLSRIAGRNSF